LFFRVTPAVHAGVKRKALCHLECLTRGFLASARNTWRAAKPHHVKLRAYDERRTLQPLEQDDTKKKKPGQKEKARRSAGLSDKYLFRSVHFASLAI
jgi:hypothetical protein